MDLPTTHYDTDTTKKASSKSERNPSEISKIERISHYLLIAAVFISPLIFIPSVYAPLDIVKSIAICSLVLLSMIGYSIQSFLDKKIVLPRSAFIYSALAVMASVIVSTFLSTNPAKSFIGQGFEIGTASYILLMFFASFLVSRLFVKDKEILVKVYAAIFGSFLILTLFHVVRIIGGVDIMNFGILPTLASTFVGKWFDFTIFSGLVALLSFIGIRFLPMMNGIKKILYALLVISAATLFISNAGFIWGTLALIFLCIGIYEYVEKRPQGSAFKNTLSSIPVFTLIVFIVATACAWKGDQLTLPLIRSLKMEQAELILPWQLTLDVTSDTLKESPFFGAGPNRFGYQYLRFKPTEINNTNFWSSEFNSGFGALPTFVTTQGMIGLIVWCFFFIFFIREGVKALRKSSEPLKKFIISSSFFSASFLWIMNILYVPSHMIFFMTFVFTGLYIGVLWSEGSVRESWFGKKEGKSALWVRIVTALFIVILILWLATYIKKTTAIAFFQKGIKELNVTKSIDKAQSQFKKALSIDESDVYYQALSEVNIIKITTITHELQNQLAQNPSQPADTKKIQELNDLIDESIKYTKQAITLDPLNYYNHLAAARIAEIGATLKFPNAYENAKNAYSSAIEQNPFNPSIYLSLARLEVSQNKLGEAEQYIGRSLQLKQNYTEAVFLLSQIQVTKGKIKEAIISTQVATQLNPNEPLLFFQLGILQYNDKNYSKAVEALEKAIQIFPQYANAKYFLGLSYSRIGQNENAIKQFEDLAKTNPDNKEVAFILSNLKAGKSPFAEVQPPIDNKPEKRRTLPVTEKTTTTTTKKPS